MSFGKLPSGWALFFSEDRHETDSKFSDDFTPFFRLWKTTTKSLGKNLKNLRQSFVAMNMMNKFAKFHKDSLKVKFNLPSAIELSEMADFVYNFV